MSIWLSMIMFWTDWRVASGAPKVSRRRAYSMAISCAAIAAPMQPAAYGMRCRERRSFAIANPPPTSPSTFAPGARRSSNWSSAA